MPRTRRFLSLCNVSLFCLFLAGCGGKQGVTVNGTLVLPTNVKLSENDHVQIVFVPEDSSGMAAPAIYSAADKSFVANNPTRKGVLPGKYKITVQFQPYPGSPDSEKRSDFFARINKQYDLDHSKLAYEVSEDPTQTVTIDLAKGTVRRN